jgi:hypothetical protein
MIELAIMIPMVLFGSVTAGVLKMKKQYRSVNLFLGFMWISCAYLRAILFRIEMMPPNCPSYDMNYFWALIGCFYLLPVFTGRLKNEKRKK